MRRISLVFVCLGLACVGDGRRVQGSQRRNAESLKPPTLNSQRRVQATGALNQLEVFRNLLLVFHPTTAFNPSSLRAHATAAHRGFGNWLAVAGHSHNRIRMPAMSDAAADIDWEKYVPSTKNLLVTGLSKDGFISVKAADTTALIAEASELQGLSGLASAALGRAITCCLLLAEGTGEDERFQVKFDGNGPIKGVLASANGNLESKGLVGNPKVDLPMNAKGKFDVGAAVGQGDLTVTYVKTFPGDPAPKPYQSTVAIQSGEVPEDINFFLAQSEQRTGALAAGVLVQGASRVIVCGGWYVDVLPFCPEERIEDLEKNLEALYERSPTQLLSSGMGPEDIIKLVLKDMEPQILSHRTPKGIVESCGCTDNSTLAAIPFLGKAALDDIFEKGEDLECKCQMCGKQRTITTKKLRGYLDELERQKVLNEMAKIKKQLAPFKRKQPDEAIEKDADEKTIDVDAADEDTSGKDDVEKGS